MRHFMLAGLALCLAVPALAASRIALEVLEPTERKQVIEGFPVAVGVVFPDGELTSVPGGRVVDDKGKAVPFEAEATGWWNPEKTRVKWVLLRFRASTNRRYAFVPGAGAVAPKGASMVAEKDGAVVVDTGPLTAVLKQGSGKLFDAVSLRGKPILGEGGASQILTITFRENVTTVRDWRVKVETSTPQRVVLKGEGFFRISWADSVAKIGVRYEFFQGESFVRIYHTLTWMIRNPKLGLQEFALSLRPALGGKGVARIGLDDCSEKAAQFTWDGKSNITAHQEKADHFVLLDGKRKAGEGNRLGGWAAMESADGRGVGIALRHAWQTHPTAFSVRKGALRVAFWPARSGPKGFMPEDIIPPDFFNNAKYWNRFRWVKKKGHFIHEYSGHPHFAYTPEGAARTHELTVFFHDKSSRRTMADLNSLAQRPLVIRQDPKSAMRVPFMGFGIEPVRKEYPGIERAIAQIGRMAVGRWEKTHDYGLWRFGMVRWGGSGVSYRWMDGHQYDILLIPWMLYMRGGDRRFFEVGEATARFAMDVATNHFNTDGHPTGYQSAASATPFPWHPTFLSKAPKVHFLAYYYHLTGYHRAKEVMDEVIAGNKAAAARNLKRAKPEHKCGHGREMYNMNVFWVNAYEETFDPEIKKYARAWLDAAIGREYNRELNVFRSPNIYLYPGLVLQHGLWKDEKLRATLLRNLAGLGFPDMPDGGVYRVEDTPGCDWAYRQTGDKRYVKVAWDAARTLADLIPDHDWSSPGVPAYPISGNAFYRQFLLPTITGYSNAARLGMKQNDPFDMRDTFISIPRAAGGKARGTVFLRPAEDGELRVRVIASGHWGGAVKPLTVTAFDPTGRRVCSARIPEAHRAKAVNRFSAIGRRFRQRAALTIPRAKQGAVYKLIVEGKGRATPRILVLADADIVHLTAANTAEMVYFYNLAGQYYVGTRIFTKATQDVITVSNPYRKPFTIRDADTGEALHHYNMAAPTKSAFRVGKGRMLRITMTGRMDGRRFKGVSPFFARTRESWFEPKTPVRP